MSKLRDEVAIVEGEIEAPARGDLEPYVIFTQLKDRGPHLYAGWVDAADDDMALQFAREHYGQDQKCVNIWAIPRAAIAGTEKAYPTSSTEGPVRPFEVFVQKKSGDLLTSTGSVEAAGSEAALDAAKERSGAPHCIWVVERDRISTTGEGDVIWRLTDQTYRMARGYSSVVREKWEKIRAERDIVDYEKDDLKETF